MAMLAGHRILFVKMIKRLPNWTEQTRFFSSLTIIMRVGPTFPFCLTPVHKQWTPPLFSPMFAKRSAELLSMREFCQYLSYNTRMPILTDCRWRLDENDMMNNWRTAGFCAGLIAGWLQGDVNSKAMNCVLRNSLQGSKIGVCFVHPKLVVGPIDKN